MFRYLDVKGKGKVRKAEFVAAVEKARISLSKEDMTSVFKRIDITGQGYFTY
jgi:Ca2+-binding EF-hand superfamily protein